MTAEAEVSSVAAKGEQSPLRPKPWAGLDVQECSRERNWIASFCGMMGWDPVIVK